MSWTALVILMAGSYAFKVLGLVGFSRLEPGPAIARATLLIPPALLAALVVVQTFSTDGALVLDARAVGLVTGGLAVWRRAPFIVVVVLAAASTALTHALS